MKSKKTKPIRASILYTTDFSAIPDIHKVLRLTNRKFPNPKLSKKVTIAIPEGLLYLATQLAKTHRQRTKQFLSIALTELLYDAYLRAHAHMTEIARTAPKHSCADDDQIPF